LTAAAIIPGIYQKSQQSLTIYHATQVLNFATISALVNLASAPLCEIWRPKPDEEPEQEEQRVEFDEDLPFDGDAGLQNPQNLNTDDEFDRRLIALQQKRPYKARIALSFALLAQVRNIC
jgi:hypothetical protein